MNWNRILSVTLICLLLNTLLFKFLSGEWFHSFPEMVIGTFIGMIINIYFISPSFYREDGD